MNSHIIEYLDYYLELDSPEFAVLITGAWGVGKTWFIKNYFSAKEKKYLHISLYGVKDSSEIDTLIFQQLHPVLSSKGAKLLGNIAKGLLKTTINIDINHDNKAEGSVSSGIPEINIPDYLRNTDEYILVFDDIERCGMDISIMLGYINHFVEHKKLKVIIIANEEEIISKQSNNEISNQYIRIKEKLIGVSFCVKNHALDAIKEFVKSLKNKIVFSFIEKKIELINDVYTISGYKNLRHLKQSISDFERIYNKINAEYKTIEAILEDILKILIIFSCEIRSGKISYEDIKDVQSHYLNSSLKIDENSSKIYTVIEKYKKIIPIDDPTVSYFFWYRFFMEGAIDSQELNSSLNKSKYLIDEKSFWIKLWQWYNLSEKEFEVVITRIEDDLHNVRYHDIGIILHIFGALLELSSLKLYDKKQENIILDANNYMIKLKEDDRIKFDRDTFILLLSATGYESLGFRGKELSSFDQLKKQCLTIMESKRDEYMTNIKSEIIRVADINIDKFAYIVSNYNPENIDYRVDSYYDYPLFKHISASDFADFIKQSDIQKIKKICHALYVRYDSQVNNKKIIDDLSFVKELAKYLQESLLTDIHRMKRYIISTMLKQYIEKAITRLEDVM